jgi:hypothetical protein
MRPINTGDAIHLQEWERVRVTLRDRFTLWEAWRRIRYSPGHIVTGASLFLGKDIELQSLPLTIKLAQMWVSYSRMPIVRAYPRETQEMVFDAHDKALAFYGRVCRRGIYDNMKTAVETVFVGRM